MSRAAAATRLLSGELDRLDGTSIRANKSTSALGSPNGSVNQLGRSADQNSKKIDKLSGRVQILGEVAASLGPALIPLGGVGIAAVAGLASELGVAAVAGGSAIIAFQGIGDTLKAVNKAQLKPTAENLAKAREEMNKLGPQAQTLVNQLQHLEGAWSGIKKAAAGGLLPGVSFALDDLEHRVPEVERIVRRINKTLGGLLSEGAANLAGPEWDQFFEFLATDARRTLTDLGRTVGNLARGAAELWMAFQPLNDFFSHGMLDASRNFAAWADGLDQTQGFQDFIAYVQENGPQVGATLGAMAGALIDITQAAAPLGGPTLQVLEAVAKVVSAIADSPIGTPLLTALAAVSAFNRAQGLTKGLMETSWGTKAQGNIRATGVALGYVTTQQEKARTSAGQLAQAEKSRSLAIGKTAGAIGGLALVSSGAADSLGVAHTATLALAGAMIGGAPGAIAGGLIGGVMDLNSALGMSASAVDRYVEKIQALGGVSAADQLAAVTAELEKQKALANTDDDHNEKWFQKSLFGIPDLLHQDAQDKAADKVKALEKAKEALAHAADLEAIATTRGSAAMRGNTLSIEQNIAAIRSRRDEALKGVTAETSLYSALLDAKDALKENGKTLDVHTRAGLANRRALEGIAGSWNQVAGTVKGTPALLHETRRSLIQAAESFGMTKEAARAYARQLMQIPPKVATKVELDTNAATAGLNSFIRNAQGRTISIGMRVANQSPNGLNVHKADGGTVPGPRAPYGDKVFAFLAPGEEVITNRNGEADQFRADRAMGRIPAYAGGGTVPGAPKNGGSALAGPNVKVLNDGMFGLAYALKALRGEVTESTKAVERERGERDALVSARDSLSATVSGKFNSDLFAKGNPWLSGGGSDPFSALKSDISGLQMFAQDQATLQGKGLDGAGLATLLAEADPSTIHDAASTWSAEMVAEFESLLQQRSQLQGSVGGAAGTAVFGAQLDIANQELADIKAELKQQTKKLEHANKQRHDAPAKTGAAVKKGTDANASKGKRNQRRDR